jgi:hypothetical protein
LSQTTIVSSRPETPTLSSAIPRRDDSAKRKLGPSNLCPNGINATKRHRPNNSHTSPLENTYVSPFAAYTLSATSSERPSATLGPPFHHVQDDLPDPTSTHPNSFVAVNQIPTNTHTAPCPYGTSVLPVTPNVPSSLGQPRASSLPSDQRRERNDAGRAQSPHSPAQPTTQVTITNPANLRQLDASRVLPSSRTGPLHPTSHNTDQQHGPNSNQTAGSYEVSLEQCELLELLLYYLFPRNDKHVEDSIILHSLERVWASCQEDFKPIMKERFSDHHKALSIWISQQRKTSLLRTMIGRQPSEQTLEMVDRVLVMNDLRALRLKWETLRVHDHGQESTPENLLCSTFAIMTRTQGLEALFKKGLERLKQTSSEVWGCDDSVISIYS